MDQNGVSNSEASASPAKRLKIERIRNADPASALDIESDDVPEELKCSTCQKVPLSEVYQCSNGHVVCNQCHLKQKWICVKCKAVMRAPNGEFIRCRALERILDALWIACPYKGKGCREVLSRGQVETHEKDCIYNCNRVQICQYFRERGSGPKCNYWSHVSRPQETLKHLNSHLAVYAETETQFRVYVDGLSYEKYVQAVVTRQNEDVFLTTMWWTDSKTLSFACLQLNKSTIAPEKDYAVELTFGGYINHYSSLKKDGFRNPTELIHKWKLSLPTTPLLDAPAVLEHKPVSVSRRFLKKYLFRDGDGQTIKLGRQDIHRSSRGTIRIVVKISIM